jgi:hypothetical protein
MTWTLWRASTAKLAGREGAADTRPGSVAARHSRRGSRRLAAAAFTACRASLISLPRSPYIPVAGRAGHGFALTHSPTPRIRRLSWPRSSTASRCSPTAPHGASLHPHTRLFAAP